MSRTLSVARNPPPSRPLPPPPTYDHLPPLSFPSPPTPASTAPSHSPSIDSYSPSYSPSIPPSLAHRPDSTFVISSTDDTLLTVTPEANPEPGVVQPVVMSWAGEGAEDDAGGGPGNTALEAQVLGLAHYELSRSDSRAGSVVRPATPDMLGILPPSYAEARSITEPVTFTFSSISFNAMLLIPPATLQDTRPLLHISVALNCFNPTSYVTTVRHGGSENGEYLGEFEMGISAIKGTVTIGQTYKYIHQVLTKDGSKHSSTGTWTWHFTPSDPRLTWTWNGPSLNCYTTLGRVPKRVQLATFSGTPLYSIPRAGSRPPVPGLRLWPAGYAQPMLAHVILSALIIERKRLSPANGDTKHLFN